MGHNDDGGLSRLAGGILAELPFSVKDIWSDRPRGVPQWVYAVVDPSSVMRVLRLARATTAELGVPAEYLEATRPSETATYWSIVFRDLYDQELLRYPVNPAVVEVDIAKRLASGVFNMHQQSRRYANFLRFGPPPGVRQLPEYTGSERTKSLAVSWEWLRTAAQKDRDLQYRSCTSAKARRVQSLRSQQCAPSDVLHPSLFN